MFEVIVNVLLFLGLGYSYFFHAVEAPIPDRVLRNPRALNPDVWPKAIIILLLICIFFNIVRLLKEKRNDPDFNFGSFFKSVGEFLRSRLLVGILLIVGACYILEPLGFMPTCFLVLFFYGMLLGDHKVVRLFIVAVLVTIFLYIMFNGFLSVNLPRGTIEQFRNVALFTESILDKVTSLF